MSQPDKKLFLLDAYALIYRAHFAFSKNPRINSKGLNTGVMMGFTNSLLQVLEKEKPTHIAVAFDTSEPTFRHQRYPEYKAHREETPEDIRAAVPWVRKIIEAFNIPILEKDGYEADDIIGTVAKKAAREGFEVYMVTPDKDFAQLVDEHIYLYKPAYMGNAVDVLGVPEVLKKWEVDRVEQVRDILGLHGDASDNIPGIPGVGAKTAVKYVKAYGSVEGLLEHVEELKGKARENVEKYGEQGLLSKELATIHTEVPLDIDWEAMRYTGPDREKLQEIFRELEFRTLSQRVLGEQAGRSAATDTGQLSMFAGPGEEAAASTPAYKTLDTCEHRYHLTGPEQAAQLAGYLLAQDEVCFDTETTHISAMEAELVGLSFSYRPGEAYFVPLPEDEEQVKSVLKEFSGFFSSEKIVKIGQNLKYDILVLKKYGCEVRGPLFDTMLAHYLIDPDSRHSMDTLARQYLHYSPVSIKNLIGGKGKPATMREVPIDQLTDYACEDADITLQLKHKLAGEIERLELQKLFYEVELPLLRVLVEMEFAGVKVDTEALRDMSKQLLEESRQVQEKIYRLAGEEFNIASPRQLGVILFDKLKLVDNPKKTKTGQYANGEEILSQLARQHEIAARILEYRELQKLKSTYVDALPGMISRFDGRIHTNYSQTVAATGRLSSNNPNLQNIPIRTARGREIRKAFVPGSPDRVLLSADYSQIELRIMASFARDEQMIEAFRQGRDIHVTTAASIFKVPPGEVTPEMRSMAKSANFGIIYGISAYGLSQNLGIPRKEAAAFIENYFKEFPAVKAYMERVISEARERGYVSTILGRKRYLRDINSRNATMRGFAERNAINAPIQGTAADIIKVAMIRIQDWIGREKLATRMILQVHDELVFEVPENELPAVQKQVPHLMQTAIELEVPLEVSVGYGKNWLEAH